MNRRQRTRKLRRAQFHRTISQRRNSGERASLIQNLNDMTKRELIEYADSTGIYVAKRWTREEMLSGILGAIKTR